MKKGSEGELLKTQLCTVTGFNGGGTTAKQRKFVEGYSAARQTDNIMLTRQSDALLLGYEFSTADLAAAAAGGTLLHLALEIKNPIFVKMILEKNPSAAEIADVAGRLPLHMMLEAKTTEMVTIILDKNAAAAAVADGAGRLPLQVAAESGIRRC